MTRDVVRPHAGPSSTPFTWVHSWCGWYCPWHGSEVKVMRGYVTRYALTMGIFAADAERCRHRYGWVDVDVNGTWRQQMRIGKDFHLDRDAAIRAAMERAVVETARMLDRAERMRALIMEPKWR